MSPTSVRTAERAESFAARLVAALVARMQPYRDAVWLVTAVISPVLAYAASMGFAASVAVAGLLYTPFLSRPRRMSPAMALLGLLLVWGLVTYSWSPALPTHVDLSKYKAVEGVVGFKLVFQLALYGTFFLGATRISPHNGRLGLDILGLLTGLAALIAITDAVDGAKFYLWWRDLLHQRIRPDYELRDLARVSYPLAVWAAPLTLAMRRSPWPRLALPLGAMLFLAALLLGKDASAAAVLMALAAYLMVRYGGRRAIWLCMGAVAFYFVAAPLVVVLGLNHIHLAAAAEVGKESWAARLEIWRLVERLIEQRPFLGWGLDASRTFAGVPLHPHNAALQIWLELGLPGAVLAALFFVWMFHGIGQLQAEDPETAGAAAGAAAAYLVIGALSFGVWQEWWLALGALTCAMIAVEATAWRSERLALETAYQLPTLA